MVAYISFIIQTCDKVPDKNIMKTAAMTVTLPDIIQASFVAQLLQSILTDSFVILLSFEIYFSLVLSHCLSDSLKTN